MRRKPATYDRILKHIAGHQITVHCTVTRQQVQRDGYLEEFLQVLVGERRTSAPSGSACTRRRSARSRTSGCGRKIATRVVADLMHLRRLFPKLQMPEGMIKVYEDPPPNPDDCVFAQTTTCVSADFKRPISPCQFGGNPDCSQCGCIASAGLGAIARHRLPGGLRVGAIFENSLQVGRKVRQLRASPTAAS